MATDYSIPKDEYKALLAESAELREYITKLEQANIVLDSDNTELRNDMRDMQMIVSENAKLRELVRSAVRCITDAPDCDSCALGEQVSGVWVCHFIGAARELGVEVGV